MKLSPILFMTALEPSVDFWTKRLGFTLTVSVPEDDHLGFAILQRDSVEIMLQTLSGAEKDLGSPVDLYRNSKSVLFVEIDDFPLLLTQVDGMPVAVADRTTFYGMREIGIYEPGGHLVIFACPVQQ